MNGYLYVASPYSHPDKKVEALRYHDACRFVAWGFRRGLTLFSPIVHCHPLALAHELPADAATWAAYDRAMIEASAGVILLMLPGHRDSKGVAAELALARALRLPQAMVLVNSEGPLATARITYWLGGVIGGDPNAPDGVVATLMAAFEGEAA